jgi:hypothetical protein
MEKGEEKDSIEWNDDISLSAASAAEAKGGGDFILFWSTAAATKGFSFLSLSHSSPSYPFFNAKMNQKGKRQE